MNASQLLALFIERNEIRSYEYMIEAFEYIL